MAKVMTCMDPNCDWEGRAETEEALFEKAAEHAETAHGLTEIPEEMWEQARAAVRDE